ncbi:ADP-ribosylglycohydrolase family protein [Catenulispora yoronensis]|uniref:ADP-ribosylglycohydrolase family protein n=1 Tax=Catenulispora yoronensis TaxID=450799 RepID=A0ABN2V985_9ACTN
MSDAWTRADAASPESAAAFASLRGLALGDSFGERWFFRGNAEAIEMIEHRTIPGDQPWHWTDDTAMALAVLRVLIRHGEVDQQDLAATFAEFFAADPMRGYGQGMRQLLPMLGEDPGNWSTYARTLFRGEGSLGNGAAMRAAPLGAWFHRDPELAAAQAVLAAEVTHAHPEGIAGGVAVAVAAALAATGLALAPDPQGFLDQTAALTPSGLIRDGLLRAAEVPSTTPAWKAADLLGNGQKVRAGDTVPFAVWSAAHHLDNLIDALWCTAEGLGDVDTTCAITGGIVAARTGMAAVPARWLELAEDLPGWAAPNTPAR